VSEVVPNVSDRTQSGVDVSVLPYDGNRSVADGAPPANEAHFGFSVTDTIVLRTIVIGATESAP
jgi:hypothetical protein